MKHRISFFLDLLLIIELDKPTPLKIIKQLFQPLVKFIIRKNVVTPPKVIDFKKKHCIGYRITTTFKGNQKKNDIPPFYHDIYDRFHRNYSKYGCAGENYLGDFVAVLHVPVK